MKTSSLPHLDDVARQADDALDVVGARVERVLEDDDVAALRLASSRILVFVNGIAEPVGELRDEDVVADLQRRDHRARRDLEGLDDERAQQERDGDRDADRLRVLAHRRLAREGQVLVHRVVERRDGLAHLLEVVAAQRLLDGVGLRRDERARWTSGMR